MLIFGKGKCFHLFGCISKNFPENIFWCLEKKKENTNLEKHKPQPKKKSSTMAIRDHDLAGAISWRQDRDQRCDLETVRSRVREIAIDSGISQSVDRGRRTRASEIGANWSSEYAGDRQTDWSSVFSSRARSLSLSLFFWKCFEVKMKAEIHFRGQGWKFRSTGNQFPENNVFRDSQTQNFPKIDFRNSFEVDSNAP